MQSWWWFLLVHVPVQIQLYLCVTLQCPWDFKLPVDEKLWLYDLNKIIAINRSFILWSLDIHFGWNRFPITLYRHNSIGSGFHFCRKCLISEPTFESKTFEIGVELNHTATIAQSFIGVRSVTLGRHETWRIASTPTASNLRHSTHNCSAATYSSPNSCHFWLALL